MVNKILDKANRYRYSKVVFLIFKGNVISVKKYTDEQKYRNLNKSCIENHFFYSADRNMETHFSLHHAVEAVLEKPKRVLYALYDIKQYLERIKPQQPEDSLAVPFLQKNLNIFFQIYALFSFLNIRVKAGTPYSIPTELFWKMSLLHLIC